jgi:hypothetical protein
MNPSQNRAPRLCHGTFEEIAIWEYDDGVEESGGTG